MQILRLYIPVEPFLRASFFSIASFLGRAPFDTMAKSVSYSDEKIVPADHEHAVVQDGFIDEAGDVYETSDERRTIGPTSAVFL